ncbi:hypothetical protein P7D22_11560 [Lichenihabitans sp. Uapishka_5]|uniref:hypothetical protein n=1 Tax=Lichenihabitans sp. Uapishka_5 TaxID=3037302 RepID=UPI0029E8100F|nr:hypothetical protein [Lichenihabitans sp. Uapishka_5]MDX7951806.1 hypothetical protein [Lichenihabitans sp. Uapishka_5]
MTKSAFVLERLAAESGHPVAAILGHVRHCPYRNNLFRACRMAIFGTVESWDLETDEKTVNDPRVKQEYWVTFSTALLADFGTQRACPNCDEPCHPVVIKRQNERYRRVIR